MKSVGLILSFLLGLSVLVIGGEADCVRKFKPPPEDDCSTETGSQAADEISCLVYGSPSVQQLEFPEANTRTCYRTCHDDTTTPNECQASLTGVHNQNIPSDVTDTERTLFSPNYNDNKNYRKSTICRYDVTCPVDHLVTYMFSSHTLESRTNTCISHEKCVDYVKLRFPNATDEEILCGTEPQLDNLVTTVHNGLVAEFYANRYEQAKGFELTVICIAPGSQPTNRRKRAENMCTQVSNAPRLTVDSAQELSDVIMSDRVLEDLRSADARLVIVNELEALVYSDLTLTVVRRRRGGESAGREESVGSGIRTLYVSNRFARSRSFHETADIRFRGYAELWISGQRAYLLQLGLNPIYKPTPDEEMVLVKLQKAINSKLECVNFFDVYDLQDAEEERVAFTPSVCEDHFVEDERLNGLAITYGNACNGLLRSVACSYQAVILQRNCTTGEPIYTTTDPTNATAGPTSATTDPTSATTSPTKATTDSTSATTNPTTDYQVSAKVPTKDPRRRTREILDKI